MTATTTSATVQFIQVMGLLIAAGLGATMWFFRKGGIYNPKMPSTDSISEVPEPPFVPASPPEALIRPIQPSSVPEPVSTLYKVAYESIGKYLTLNDSIRPEVGCAQAVSWILLNAGYPIARNGISTVANLTKWMLKQGFVEEKKYGVGYVITGRNATSAHIGICGKDWVMSNTSYTDTKKGLIAGTFQANFRRENWGKVYPQVRFFRPV